MCVHVAFSSPLTQESLVVIKHWDLPGNRWNPGNWLPLVQYLKCIGFLAAGLCWYLWCCPTPSSVSCQVQPVTGRVLFPISQFLPQKMAQDHPWTSALRMTMDLLLLHMENCGETETARCEVCPLSLHILILQLSDLGRAVPEFESMKSVMVMTFILSKPASKLYMSLYNLFSELVMFPVWNLKYWERI